jgi:succinate dehydrogenase / fumarate reductase, flavoprotein subunit
MVGALIDGRPVTIGARAVVLATGGLQGLFEFTDNPDALIGDGHGMAVAAGAALVDIEFMQFYPISVREEGVPTIFLYPDFPRLATLINDKGENVLVKHLGEGAKYFAGLQNWDQLAAVVKTEIVEGRGVYVDLSETKSTDWAPDSLTGTFLSKCVPTFMKTPVRVAPSAHYTVGGLKVDVDGRTNLPNVYAAGEVAGGVHGANRHGGTALVDAITFGRIAGQHAARNLDGNAAGRNTSLLPPSRKAGRQARRAELMGNLRRTNQFALGPIRDGARLQSAGERFAEFREEALSFGWNDYAVELAGLILKGDDGAIPAASDPQGAARRLRADPRGGRRHGARALSLGASPRRHRNRDYQYRRKGRDCPWPWLSPRHQLFH